MQEVTVQPAPIPDYKYWAFISFSHQDNRLKRADGSGDHIPWADWLHEQLETFRVPDGYRDHPTRTGEPMPERFFPAFRDEAELPTSHDLGGLIRDALARSRFLIIIASPRSARSRYVNEEVRHFRQLGRGDRILTLIVDGEPNVRHHLKPGWTAGDDCFCPALVHPLRPDGEVDTTRLLAEEPIAADVRVKDTVPPREMRTTERNHPDSRALLDFMKLKLIAGLMGAGLDELVQRDKRRVLEEARRRAKTLRRWLAVVGGLALAAIAAAKIAWRQSGVAERRRIEATEQRNLAEERRVRAEVARRDAETLLTFLQNDVRNILGKLGRLDLMERINEEVEGYYHRNSADGGAAAALRGKSSTRFEEGQVFQSLGKETEANIAYADAERLAREALRNDRSADALGLLGAALVKRATLVISTQPVAARAFCDESLRLADEIRLLTPDSEEPLNLWSAAIDVRARIAKAENNFAAALSDLQAGSRALRERIDSGKTSNSLAGNYVRSLQRVCETQLALDQSPEALATAKLAAETAEKVSKSGGFSPEFEALRASSLITLGDAFGAARDHPGAREKYATAANLAQALVANDVRNQDWLILALWSHERLGHEECRVEEYASAAAFYEQQLAAAEALRKADLTAEVNLESVARACRNLSHALIHDAQKRGQQPSGRTIEIIDRGLEVVDQWLRRSPSSESALSIRWELQSLKSGISR